VKDERTRRQNAAVLLRSSADRVHRLTSFVGFDGFVDGVYRVVREKHDDAMHQHFTRITEFGNYIVERDGASLSLELDMIDVKIGGNAPILANALALLGVETAVVAPVDTHDPMPTFADGPHLTHYSYGEPATTVALEFGGAKLLLADLSGANDLTWQTVRDRIGRSVLQQLVDGAAALAIVNWGELASAMSIWSGLLSDLMPAAPNMERTILFDLSDSSKRSAAEHAEVAALMRRFGAHGATVWSANAFEAKLLYDSVCEEKTSSTDERVRAIGLAAGLEWAVVHGDREAVGWDRRSDSISRVPISRIAAPVLTTGGGDNFNAGLLVARLLGFDMEHSLAIGNAAARCYVSDGASPSFERLIRDLEEQ